MLEDECSSADAFGSYDILLMKNVAGVRYMEMN